MQKGVSVLPEYEFMKPACDFNLTNVSEQTHLCGTGPWGKGLGGGVVGGVDLSVGGWFLCSHREPRWSGRWEMKSL